MNKNILPISKFPEIDSVYQKHMSEEPVPPFDCGFELGAWVLRFFLWAIAIAKGNWQCDQAEGRDKMIRSRTSLRASSSEI